MRAVLTKLGRFSSKYFDIESASYGYFVFPILVFLADYIERLCII